MTFFEQKLTNFVENTKIFLKFKDVTHGDFGWKLTIITCCDFWDFHHQKHVFSSKSIVFCIGNQEKKLIYVRILNA